VIKRTLGAEPTYAYYLSNAPVSTPLRTFVWLSGLRWAVEQCFEEGKTELGMAHYEVRKYPGWHHHMLMTMLAHFFLWHLKSRLEKKSARADGIAAAEIIGRRLPLRIETIDEVLAFVAWVQRRNHTAYLSHRKRRQESA